MVNYFPEPGLLMSSIFGQKLVFFSGHNFNKSIFPFSLGMLKMLTMLKMLGMTLLLQVINKYEKRNKNL